MRQTFLKKISASGTTLAASTDFVAPGNLLPTKTADGRVIYHRGWIVEVDATITFTTNPGEVGHNALIKRAQWGTGNQLRYALSGNAIRAFEVLEGGKRKQTPAIQTASASARFVSFYIPNGPHSAANQDDFDIACANLTDAEFRVTTGALLDLSVDTTVLTGTLRMWAVLAVDDTLDAGVFYERREETLGSGAVLQGQCLLACVGVAEPAYGAFTAGDFSTFTIETGTWNIVDSVDASTLAKLHNYQFAPGEIDALTGEPRGATDVNQRAVNLTSPTALAAQGATTADFHVQPILVWQPGQDLTGLLGRVAANCNVKWSGTVGANAIRLLSRFLPVTDQRVKQDVDQAARVLGKTALSKTLRVRAKTGKMVGPHAVFMRRGAVAVGR